jgi:sulfoxide reductase heme-binding subunit YedZ
MNASFSILASSLSVAWPWYVVRAAGIVAVILLLLLMMSGIGMMTGFTYRYIEPLKAWTIHRAFGIALALSVCIHGLFLLLDSYKPYSLAGITIPFVTHTEHSSLFGLSVGSLYTTFGIISSYVLVVVLVSSLTIIESRKRLWRKLHYLSYLLMVLVFFHALFLGTDFKHGFVRILWVTIGIVLILGIIMRLRRAGTVLPNKLIGGKSET